MRSKEGKKIIIIDNLEAFADKSLSLISDESDAGRQRFITLWETAYENYTKPWFSSLSRHRGQEVQETIKAFATLPDAYTRLQEFKVRIEKGEWHPNSSFNYFLFVEIIRSVPGYVRAKDKEVEIIVERLRPLISERIDGFMRDFRTNQKLIEEKAQDLERTQQRAKKSLEHVHIINSLETAKSVAMSHPTKSVFCLTFDSTKWNLSWIDIMGKAYKLQPSEELIQFLVDHQVSDIEQVNAVQIKRVKHECIQTRDAFLNKTQLLINPKDPVTLAPISNYSLILQGTCTAFVLRGNNTKYSLSWINTLAQEIEIPLDKYPKMKQWLNSLSSLTEEHLPLLKSYLLHVDTKKPLEVDDFKKDLANCLSKTKVKVLSPLKENKTKRIDLSLFGNIEKCLAVQAGIARTEVVSAVMDKPAPGRLNITDFAVSTLFGHKEQTENPVIEVQAGIVLS